MAGIEVAATMGVIVGDFKKELMVISNVLKEKFSEMKAYLDSEKIHVKLYIRVEAELKELIKEKKF